MPAPSPCSTPSAVVLSAEPLRQAVLSCPHTIEASQVVLEFDASQPGHNALNQLGRRLAAAAAVVTANAADAAAAERAVTDFLLARLGLSPESCRGEDGGIDLQRVQSLLAKQGVPGISGAPDAQEQSNTHGQALTNTKEIPS